LEQHNENRIEFAKNVAFHSSKRKQINSCFARGEMQPSDTGRSTTISNKLEQKNTKSNDNKEHLNLYVYPLLNEKGGKTWDSEAKIMRPWSQGSQPCAPGKSPPEFPESTARGEVDGRGRGHGPMGRLWTVAGIKEAFSMTPPPLLEGGEVGSRLGQRGGGAAG